MTWNVRSRVIFNFCELYNNLKPIIIKEQSYKAALKIFCYTFVMLISLVVNKILVEEN